MVDNNPLRQYFRRPSIYFRLPSDGRYYDASVVSMPPNRELPVYTMTAIDEMTVRTPDALFNGTEADFRRLRRSEPTPPRDPNTLPPCP
jgi:hypothetical protein